MSRPHRGWLALGVLASTVFLGGCMSAVQTMEVRDDLRIYRESHPLAAGTAAQGAEAKSITVATTKNLTGQLTNGLVFQLSPATTEKAPDSLVAGLFIRGGGEAIATALDQHLRAERPSWSSTMAAPSAQASSADVVIRPISLEYVGKGAFVHTMRVTLAAETKDGRKFEVSGTSDSESTAGHLGWAIPALVVTGFTAFVFVGPTMRAVNNGVDERGYAVAVDRACSQLLAQLDGVAAQPPIASAK